MIGRVLLDEPDPPLAPLGRVVVLYRGVGCPYSATFEKVFHEIAPPKGWTRLIREVEEGAHGPVGERHGVDITPTVAAFEDAREVARLEGKLLLGITRGQYAKWLKGLGRAGRS